MDTCKMIRMALLHDIVESITWRALHPEMMSSLVNKLLVPNDLKNWQVLQTHSSTLQPYEEIHPFLPHVLCSLLLMRCVMFHRLYVDEFAT